MPTAAKRQRSIARKCSAGGAKLRLKGLSKRARSEGGSELVRCRASRPVAGGLYKGKKPAKRKSVKNGRMPWELRLRSNESIGTPEVVATHGFHTTTGSIVFHSLDGNVVTWSGVVPPKAVAAKAFTMLKRASGERSMTSPYRRTRKSVKNGSVRGSRALGAKLTQWHYGASDPVYAVGSNFYGGHTASMADAKGALRNLKIALLSDRNAADMKHLKSAIKGLESAIKRAER